MHMAPAVGSGLRLTGSLCVCAYGISVNHRGIVSAPVLNQVAGYSLFPSVCQTVLCQRSCGPESACSSLAAQLT